MTEPDAPRRSWLLALGSNAADAGARLDAALDALTRLGRIERRSGRADGEDVSARGPRYLNQLVVLDSDHDDRALTAALKAIERAQGRSDARDDGICVLDIDLLATLDGGAPTHWHDRKPLRIPAVQRLLQTIELPL